MSSSVTYFRFQVMLETYLSVALSNNMLSLTNIQKNTRAALWAARVFFCWSILHVVSVGSDDTLPRLSRLLHGSVPMPDEKFSRVFIHVDEIVNGLAEAS